MGSLKIQGTLEQIIGKRIKVKTRSAVTYDVDTSQAVLVRKNTQPLPYEEFKLHDKVEVEGQGFSDNSILATKVRNLSVYPRKLTVSGKVESVDASGFSMWTSMFGKVIVVTSNLTTFVNLTGVNTGSKVKVSGMWERPQGVVQALVVRQTGRRVKVEFTGQLVMRSTESITVVANGVIYGVDITHAKLLEGRKSIGVVGLPVGGMVKVLGKHFPESVSVEGASVKVVK